jgi:predicted Zn finger-like uncharacterized protein
MKIICDNCRTKYSIADEKVKGKVFKIRCKKCSNIIVVRGNQPQPEASGEDYAAPAAAEGGESFGGEAPTWHLVVDQKQVGPMTASEVRDRFARGEIDAETYIWREGFSDWLRISQVEDFSDIAQSTMVSAGAPAAAAGAEAGYEQPQDQPQAWSADAGGGQQEQWGDAGGGGGGGGGDAQAWDAGAQAPSAWSADEGGDTSRAESDNLFGGGGQPADDPGRDLFGTGEAAPDSGYSTGAAAAASGGEGGLFGAASAAPAPAEGGGADIFGGGGGGNGGQQMFPQEEEPQPDGSAMTGQRNENSVLFSLTNLQALAMGGGGKSAAAPATSGGGGGGGADGSGLIDIRSMAGSSPAPAAASSSGEEAGLPDLGGFSAPIAAAPVLIASGADERPKWLIPTLIGGGVVLVGAIAALVILLVVAKPDPVPVAAVTPPTTGETKPATEPKEEPKEEKKDEAKTAGATENAAEATKAETKSTARASTSKRRRPRRSRRSSRRSETRVAAKDPAPAPTRKPRGRRDALDDLIDGAVGKRKQSSRTRSSKPAPSADSNLPDQLGRSEIQRGMRGIKAKVQGCYDRYKVPGMANVQVRIGRNGRVSSARVKGMFSGTPTGACVQAAARSARFPRFKGSPMSITYPFILR